MVKINARVRAAVAAIPGRRHGCRHGRLRRLVRHGRRHRHLDSRHDHDGSGIREP